MRMSRRSFASRLESGSSMRKTDGSLTMVRARATRCASPPEHSLGRLSSRAPMCIASAAALTRRSTSASSVFFTRSPNAMFSNTVMCGKRARSWNTMPRPRSPGSRSFTTWSPMKISPEVGVSRPEIMLRVVVLPQPDGPTMMRNSPSSIRRWTPATATADPKCFTRSRRTISATAFLQRAARHPVRAAPRRRRRRRRGPAPRGGRPLPARSGPSPRRPRRATSRFERAAAPRIKVREPSAKRAAAIDPPGREGSRWTASVLTFGSSRS